MATFFLGRKNQLKRTYICKRLRYYYCLTALPLKVHKPIECVYIRRANGRHEKTIKSYSLSEERRDCFIVTLYLNYRNLHRVPAKINIRDFVLLFIRVHSRGSYGLSKCG